MLYICDRSTPDLNKDDEPKKMNSFRPSDAYMRR